MKGTPSVTLRTGAGLRTKPEDLVAAPVEPPFAHARMNARAVSDSHRRRNDDIANNLLVRFAHRSVMARTAADTVHSLAMVPISVLLVAVVVHTDGRMPCVGNVVVARNV